MDINRMRLGLVYIFSENKNLTKETKIQLINFIEGANEHQLKSLALDGSIDTSDKLDEQACSILDDRFEASANIQESIKKASLEAVNALSEVVPFVVGAVAGGITGHILLKKKAKQVCAKYQSDPEKYKACTKDVVRKGWLKSKEVERDKEERKAAKAKASLK
jgi:hypothetical protein